jgi:hypothetical protein
MLPDISDVRRIEPQRVSLLDRYPQLSVIEARALVKAARAYQDAIWIADGDPRQAWLRLVTAVESVAGLAPRLPSGERLRAAFPDEADRLASQLDPDLLVWITEKLADNAGVTAKFVGFLTRFGPSRPAHRVRHTQLNWTDLGPQLRNIYAFRSKDLHQGVPFPQWLCRPPGSFADEITYLPRSDRPQMQLQVFEYVVRRSLQSWWRASPAQRETP